MLRLSGAAAAVRAAAQSLGGELVPPELATAVLTAGGRLKGQAGSYRTLDGKAAFRIDLDRYVPDQALQALFPQA